jgi:hypothetical protein
MRALRVLALSLLGVAVGVPALAAGDEPQPSCGVKVILASHEGAGLDPKLNALKHYLAKDPFTAYKSFQLVDEKKWAVRPSQTDKLKLPNGKEMALTYLETVSGTNGAKRVRMRLEITDDAKKLLNTTFALDEGAYVLQAGQRHGNGLLILGLSCDKK